MKKTILIFNLIFCVNFLFSQKSKELAEAALSHLYDENGNPKKQSEMISADYTLKTYIWPKCVKDNSGYSDRYIGFYFDQQSFMNKNDFKWSKCYFVQNGSSGSEYVLQYSDNYLNYNGRKDPELVYLGNGLAVRFYAFQDYKYNDPAKYFSYYSDNPVDESLWGDDLKLFNETIYQGLVNYFQGKKLDGSEDEFSTPKNTLGYPLEIMTNIDFDIRNLSSPKCEGAANYFGKPKYLVAYHLVENGNLLTYSVFYDTPSDNNPDIIYASIPLSNLFAAEFRASNYDAYGMSAGYHTIVLNAREKFDIIYTKLDGTGYYKKSDNFLVLKTSDLKIREAFIEEIVAQNVEFAMMTSEEREAEANLISVGTMFGAKKCGHVNGLDVAFVTPESGNTIFMTGNDGEDYFWGEEYENEKMYPTSNGVERGNIFNSDRTTLFTQKGTVFYDADGVAKYNVVKNQIYKGDSQDELLFTFSGGLKTGNGEDDNFIFKTQLEPCIKMVMCWLFLNR